MTTLKKISNYLLLMRLHRPIGILLLLWPTLMGLWIAQLSAPPLKLLSIFIIGAIIMRSAGCIINDFFDMGFDGFVARTKTRPLITKTVSPREALCLFCILLSLAFILVLQTNLNTILLAFGVLSITMIYPLMKRITYYPQIVLGIAFASGVSMAYTALEQPFDYAMWLLFTATVIWAVIYDTMYAMVDITDDLRIGVKSTAIAFGNYDRLIIGILQLIYLILFMLLGKAIHANIYYYCSLGVTISLMLYQQYLIKDRNPASCFKAFLNNNYIGMSLFIGIVFTIC